MSEYMINLDSALKAMEEAYGEEAANLLRELATRPMAIHVHEEATEDGDESWHLECPVCHTQDAITWEQWVKNACSVVETWENEFQAGSDEINWDAVTDDHMRCESYGTELEAPDNLICY